MTIAAAETGADEREAVFRLLDVEKTFPIRRNVGWFSRRTAKLPALDGVRLLVRQGTSVALVGESGSGKSTLLRVLLGLDEPTNGTALYRGRQIAEVRARDPAFPSEVAMVYQDARGSLNPRMSVGALIAEPLVHFGICRAGDTQARVVDLLARVGLPSHLASSYPAALSGGQVRRVAIARALASGPSVLVADEAVSGLDVSTQAQLLDLLRRLQREMGLTLLFITHDLGVASHLCDEIAIMYLGRIVELGPTNAVLDAPAHPYTRALRAAAPAFFAPLVEPLPGELPSPLDLPPGCRFAGRCVHAQEACRQTDPVLSARGADRQVACLFPLTPEPGAPA